MRPPSPLLLFFLLLLPPPPAQAQTTLVHPPVYATEEGQSWSNYPFAWPYTPPPQKSARWLQVHDRLLKSPGKIRALSFRREGLYLHYYFAPFGVTLELSLSTARTTSRTLSADFAANHGGDLTVVIPKTKIYFRATMPRPALPFPEFDYTLSFTSRPFSLAAGKGLCWEVKVYDNTLIPYLRENKIGFDMSEGSPRALVRLFGRGSFAPGRSLEMYPEFQISWSLPPASVWTMSASLYRGPARGSAFLLFSRAGNTAGIPLPGGEGYLHLDPANLLCVIGPRPISFYGWAYITRPDIPPIPAYPSLYGTKAYGQFLCTAPGSAALYASQAAIIQFPRKWSTYYGPYVGTCFNNSLTSKAARQVLPGKGLITRFLVQ